MTAFACDMTVFSPDEPQQHLAAIRDVFGAVLEIRELADGYAFRFSNDERMLIRIASFVAKERLCCPFFGFRIEVAADGGPVWLSLTGGEGIKPFILAEVGSDVREDVATTFGFR